MRPKRWKRLRRRLFLLVAALCFLFLLLAGLVMFSLSEAQLKRRLLRALRSSLDPACALNEKELRISFSFSEGFLVEGLQIDGPPRYHESDCVSVERIRAVPKLGSLLTGRLAFHAVEVYGCHVAMEYSRTAGWNVANLLRPRGESQGALEEERDRELSSSLPGAITFRECSLSFCSSCLAELLAVKEEDIPAAFTNGTFQGRVEAGEDRVYFNGRLTHELFNDVELRRSSITRSENRLELNLSVSRVRLAEDAIRLLPENIRKDVIPYDPSGVVTAAVSAVFHDGENTSLTVAGTVADGGMTVPRLPYRLRHTKGRFSFDGAALIVKDIRGSMADGILTGEARCVLSKAGTAPSWSASFALDRVALDERIAQILPADVREVWENLSPRGSAGLTAELTWADKALTWEGTITLLGVNAAWSSLPYPLRNVRGKIAINQTALTADAPLTGVNGSTKASIAGRVELKREGAVDLRFGLTDLSLDRELRSYLPEKSRKVWDDFQLGGLADAVVVATREAGHKEVHTAITLKGKGARIRYKSFPYPIDRITGSILIARDEVRVIEELAGRHGDTRIRCGQGGYWRTGRERPAYHFEFASGSLPVDQALVQALEPAQRQVLNEFQFEGLVGVAITLSLQEDTPEPQLDINAMIKGGKVKHVSFPYPLQLESGALYIGADVITITDLETQGRDFSVRCKRGRILQAADEIQYDLDLQVTGLETEPALLEALPEHVTTFLKSLAVRGEFDAPSIAIHYTHQKSKPAESEPKRYSLTYRAELETQDAAMNMGIKFRHIKGKATIIGKASHDYPHKASGELLLESLRFHRLKLTDIKLKCTYGRRHALLDDIESRELDSFALRLRHGKDFVTRFSDDAAARDAFQVWLEEATGYDGNVCGFMAVDVGGAKDIMAEVFVTGVDLKAASGDIFKEGQATGLAKANAFFTGKMQNLKTLEGDGQLMLREANLVKLPMFVSMFNVLKLQPMTTSYFHKVQANFVFDKGRFKAPSRTAISMESEYMTLRGGGTVDFDLNTDLYLSLPSLGLPNIPVVSDVLKLLVDNILVFHVTGPADKPSVNVVPMQDILSLFGGAED